MTLTGHRQGFRIPLMLRTRVASSLLAIALASGGVAQLPVQPVAAATSTVIEDAVVVLNLPSANAYDWDEAAHYYDWNTYDYGYQGYRLPGSGRAQYISGFGGGNGSAVITEDGGCSFKSATGAVWCFGRNSLDGDGTRRDIPVPRVVPGIEATEIEYISTARNSYLYYYPSEGSTQNWGSQFSFDGICALSEGGAVKCWGKTGSESMLSPANVTDGNVARLFTDGAITHDGEADWSVANGHFNRRDPIGTLIS